MPLNRSAAAQCPPCAAVSIATTYVGLHLNSAASASTAVEALKLVREELYPAVQWNASLRPVACRSAYNIVIGSAARHSATCPLMRLVTMSGASIRRQLHLEERLLHRTKDNWCVFNDSTGAPINVMGVSGRVLELVEIEPALRDKVPIVRRFSGGGTIIVDQGTVFVTFIFNRTAVEGLQPFQRNIMSWSGQLYVKVFDRFGEFHLRNY
ncbi:lipoate-protein ligase LplJ [Panicum miliaceum]|uniref:Lipoate-protein ligase LplJ n=1 Tax=Panicum miliaceum TaxID=4540 RepID=A0A3L6PRZ0_PANMI|nr:lipoate-protein ligase LplJ [Panicum miliaceum]